MFSVIEENEENDRLNLINVAINTDENGYLHVYAFPGKDYVSTFGDEFLVQYETQLDPSEADEQNAMRDEYGHPLPLVALTFILNPTKTRVAYLILNYDEQKQKNVPCDLLLKGDVYLLSFYVLAKMSPIPKTRAETTFYQGIGHALLCWALKNVPELSGKRYLTLHANAGDTPEENAPLVKYYEKLGFVRCFDGGAAYELLECMIGSIEEITQRCDKFARRFVTPLRSGRKIRLT